MDLQKLEFFVCVSQLGNLSKAAVALGTLPSIVSRQIAALERTCDGKLFHRTGRGMTLTDLGERLLPRAQATLAEFRNLQAEIRSQQGVISGDVRIGLVPSLAQAISASLFVTVQQLYPAVRLIVMEGVSAQLDTWRSNDEVDITILFRAGQSELRNEDSLGSVDTYLVGARGDALTAGPCVRFSELAQLPLVLASAPNGLRADVEKQAHRLGIPLSIVLETNSLAVQTELAARGGAYTIMAGHAASQRLGAGLQASRIVEPTIARTIAMGIASHRPASDATRHIARHARMHIMEAFKTMGMPEDALPEN
ncbi:MAG: LysR substrate-binding domain-containing protein [Pseudomonadota bacterium]